MKKDIHPKYYTEAKVTCACGNNFTIGSTEPEIEVEVCSACHPFYTGQSRFIDNEGRIKKFKKKKKEAETEAKREAEKTRREEEERKRKEKEKEETPKTLKEMLEKIKE